MTAPLDGIKVIELATMIATPAATHLLATQGAEVIKIEDTAGGDLLRHYGSQKQGISGWFANSNAGKRSIALDLTDAGASDALWALIESADVFIEGFRPGVVERLGFGWDEAHRRNPTLVYVASSGFGRAGPYADRPVYDPVIQSLAGWTAAQQVDGRPTLIKGMVADKVAAMTTAQAITAALVGRAVSGEGRYLSMSMLESNLAFVWPDVMMHDSVLDDDAIQMPNLLRDYRLLACADGFITVAAGTDAQWNAMCDEFGRRDYRDDPRMSTAAARVGNMVAWYDAMEEMVHELPTDEAVTRLRRADVPVERILELDEIVDDEHIASTGAIVEIEHPIAGRVRMPQQAARFVSVDELAPAPAYGQHTDEILAEIGFDESTVGQLRDRGAAR